MVEYRAQSIYMDRMNRPPTPPLNIAFGKKGMVRTILLMVLVLAGLVRPGAETLRLLHRLDFAIDGEVSDE